MISYGDFLIEDTLASMELRFVAFLHIMNRAVYIESTRLNMFDKRERENEFRKERGKGCS